MTKRYVFAGKVQGVGFRQFVWKSQQDLNVTGFVRNLASGEVELVIKGDDASCDELLKRIDVRFSENIDRIDLENIEDGAFSEFVIRP